MAQIPEIRMTLMTTGAMNISTSPGCYSTRAFSSNLGLDLLCFLHSVLEALCARYNTKIDWVDFVILTFVLKVISAKLKKNVL